ncbi:MAG: NGG1p interacting factor NIF3 [Legionellales bacterium]|jgi:structural toxin protein (hemagglutinin/hemolysin) RtxA|nr:NGG1p interacting factor NIF3 [Legionellales bacterium]
MAYFNFSFYVPTADVEAVKNAVFEAGAGVIGEYSCCGWQVLGQGQFIAGANSNPAMGEKNKMTSLDEYLVNIICAKDLMQKVLNAFFAAHPYEEPAYFFTPILTKEDI